MEYVGMDLHQKYAQLCVLDEDGGIIEETRVPTTHSALSRWFGRGDRTLRVAVEASGSSPWVDRLLRELGHEVFVVNPRRVRLIAEATLKTDKVDAHTLARLVRIDPDFMAPITPRSEQAQYGRGIHRVRSNLVRCRTRMINAVRGILRSFGYVLRRWDAANFATRIQEEPLPIELAALVHPLVQAIAQHTDHIHELDRDIAALARDRPEVRRMHEIPGIGLVTAHAFVLCIDNPRRFPDSRDVGAYLGLHPRIRQSGDVSRRGRTTRQGDSYVRTLLVQAAHSVMRSKTDTELKRFGLRLAERVGKKKAAVAVARKLAVLMHLLWVRNASFDTLPHQVAA